MKKIFTLCIAHRHPNVLLGMKKRGFGKGKWNGFGGKVEKNESIEDAATREVQEESGIIVRELDKAGVLDFEFKDKDEILEVHIFHINKFEGEIKETEEMKTQWFHINEIPYKDMWPDDKYWFPLFFKRKRFKGRFLFDSSDSILESQLLEVKKL